MMLRRYTGAVAIVAVWAMLITGIAVTKISVPGTRFYSYLWTTDFQPVFSLVMATSATLLAVFFLYVKDTNQTSSVFKYAAAAVVLGTLITATVPYDNYENGRTREWFHLSGTAALLIGLPVLLISFARANRSSWAGKLSYVLFGLEVVVLVVGGALFVLADTTVIEPGSLLILSAWAIAMTAHSPVHERKEP